MKHKEVLYIVNSIEGWLSNTEILFLYEASRRCHARGNYVEIGSFKGKSTTAIGLGMNNRFEGRKLYAVDPHESVIEKNDKKGQSTYPHLIKTIKKHRLENLVVPIVATSKKAGKSWKSEIAFLFIDGLHDEENALLDYKIWNKYVTEEGIIAFHDGFCGMEGVWNVIKNKVLKRADLIDIGAVGSIFYVVLGKVNIYNRFLVDFKIKVVKLSNYLHFRHLLPPIILNFLIHKIFKLMIFGKYTFPVYIK